MMRLLTLFFCLSGLIFLQFCSTSKGAMSGKKDKGPVVIVSYNTDVAPILLERCTPCHFPDGGKKKFLDTHAAVKENIDDILYRTELPIDSSKFMPWKSKKPPLSDSLIAVLKVWKESGMAE